MVRRMGFLTNLFTRECPNCHVKATVGGETGTIDVIHTKEWTEGSLWKLNRTYFTESTYTHRVCRHTWTEVRSDTPGINR
jgi:hypothetical protein